MHLRKHETFLELRVVHKKHLGCVKKLSYIITIYPYHGLIELGLIN